jgi:hypothetical protein
MVAEYREVLPAASTTFYTPAVPANPHTNRHRHIRRPDRPVLFCPNRPSPSPRPSPPQTAHPAYPVHSARSLPLRLERRILRLGHRLLPHGCLSTRLCVHVRPLLVRLFLPRDRQLPRQEGLRLQSERAYLRLQVHLRLLLRGLFFRQPVRGLCVRLFLGAD